MITDFVVRIVDAVRNCLARFPIIGPFFAIEEVAPITTSAAAITTPPRPTNAELVTQLYTVFPNANGRPSTGPRTLLAVNALPAPEPGVVIRALDAFRLITDPAAQMEAFQIVLQADNSTDDIGRQFYNQLSPEMQRQFREQIWIANNRHDAGMGAAYGDLVVAHFIRSSLGQQAAAALQGIYAAAATTETTL
jgi:hypothetical protein